MFGLISSYWTSVLTLGGIYAVAAIGLQAILVSGQFSVMQAALMGCGGYAAAAGGVYLHLGFALSVLLAVGVAAVLGAASSILLLRLHGLFFAIATLAIGQALYYAVQLIPKLGGAGGLQAGTLGTTANLVVGLWLGLLALYLVLRRSLKYVSVLAIGRDPIAAEALGLSTKTWRVGIFAAGSALAGLAGALYVQYVGLIQPPDLNFAAESQLLIFVVIGGVETPIGAALGALGITVLLEALRVSSQDRYWILGVALVIVTILRPWGILRRRPIYTNGWRGQLEALTSLRHERGRRPMAPLIRRWRAAREGRRPRSTPQKRSDP